MTRSYRVLTMSVCLAAAFATGAAAQTAPPQRSGNFVAVLDMKMVFEHHSGFKERIESIKKEIEAFEKDLNGQLKALADQVEQLKQQFKPTSSQYRKQEAVLARQESNLRVKAQLKRKEVLEKEARVYYETYGEISSIVASIAQNNGIALVLRYDSQKMDPNDRGTVLRGVNCAIVFQRDLELTWHVIKQVNPQAAKEHFNKMRR